MQSLTILFYQSISLLTTKYIDKKIILPSFQGSDASLNYLTLHSQNHPEYKRNQPNEPDKDFKLMKFWFGDHITFDENHLAPQHVKIH